MGRMIEFPANGHSTPGFLAQPASGTGPGLLVIQEWWGLVDHIKDLVDRFAAEGFVALAPDLYHGTQTKSPDEAGKLLMALNIARAGADLRGAATYLLGTDAVTSTKIGALGFCMGGQLALFAGMEYPDTIGACVDFYGIHPHVKIVPAKVKVPVLGHFATRDKSVPEAQARSLMSEIQVAGGTIEGYFYDADHAFFNDTRPQVYDPSSAKVAWERSLAFLRHHLVA